MNPNFRVLVVDLSTRFGGTSTRTVRLLAAMPPGMGAIATLEGTPVFQQAQDLGLETHVVGRRKLDLGIARKLGDVVRRGRFQLLDSQNPQSKFWASRVARKLDLALVSTLNSWYMSEHQGRWRGRFYQMMESVTSRRLDHFVTVAKEIYDNVLLAGYPPEMVSLIVNAVNIDAASIPDERFEGLPAVAIPADAFVLCAVGRLVQVKGYKYLLRAMGLLRTKYPHLHCVIVGNGGAEAELRDEVRRLNLERQAHLVGFQTTNRVLQLVKGTDMFVMPSLSEGTPVALLEAAALARPIVASDVGGIPTILTHDQQALLVPPGDERLLADAIATLIDDPERARRLGRRAAEHIRAEFSLAKQVDDTLAAYEKALAHSRARLGAVVSHSRVSHAAPVVRASRN